MPEKVFIQPADGRLVRDPATMQEIPAGGASVALDSFWRRRIAEGDVKVIPATNQGGK